MRQNLIVLTILFNFVVLVACKSFYSIIAPGSIKSNRKYTVAVSLHESDEPAVINVRIEGPLYYTARDVHLQAYQTKSVVFELPKLAPGQHMLIAESISGFKFRNESNIYVNGWESGAKIYIQTDKAIYKPGDEVQFRVVLLDEHTRPLKIEEPILVEILNNNGIRVKQLKDVRFVKGIYKAKFLLSEYPVLGRNWQIKVTINGKYDATASKYFQVQKYVLPKFSVYIKADDNFLPEDRVLKALIYGKYTFDKYVEGNLTASLEMGGKVLQQKNLNIATTAIAEFSFDDPSTLKDVSSVELRVELTEKHTGLTHRASANINIRKQRYEINVDSDSIQYQNNIPNRLKAQVRHWNGSPVLERQTPVIMKHGPKEYKAYLDGNGEALFEFEHDSEANHMFEFKNSTYTYPNIFVPDKQISKNDTETYCKLRLKGSKPRLGTKLEVEVYSSHDIPYLIYTIMGHANILKSGHIKMPPNQKSYTIEITPSIEMIPQSYIYVHYILDGNLRYDELTLAFPSEFENQISVAAPKEVKPGREVTIELKAQPKSYVGLLAVDLGVYLLDSSYDIYGGRIMNDLRFDSTYSPTAAIVYPGKLSGALTLTNAHHEIVLPQGGAAGGGYGGGIGGHGALPSVRNKFPETWIFENYEITNETTRLALTVPDSITTWRITAFSVNDITGFGIVNGPTDIIARQAFFINLNLPYSVKRGEIIKIPIIVHNYNNQSVDTEITLYNEDREFEFVESDMSIGAKGSEEKQRLKRLSVPENGVDKVEFIINPKRVGEISLRVTAENSVSSDAVIRKLKVEPEGVAKRKNKPLYARIPAGETFAANIATDIPDDIVPESEYLTLSVGGDSLVPTLKHLNGLVLLPTGCGEQNMVNFAPNILVLQYLKASGKYFKERELVSKAKQFIEIGYQQQLSYRHSNGGYSVFGPTKDKEASTWLTAYVIRFFIKVSSYFSIEPKIIESGLEYLAKEQLFQGDFPYTGYLFYPAQQNRFGFTAFVLMTFMENGKYAAKYELVIKKGLAFLNTNLDKLKDIYALSIVANALQMAKHEKAQQVIDMLKLQRNEKEDLIWWSENDRNREKDVEITGYALMGLLGTDNDSTEDLNIHKWLVGQRNGRGGFKSTHDTVVGLQALVKFSQKYNNVNNMNLRIKYSAKNELSDIIQSNELLVDSNNLLILQTNELPRNTRSLDVNVTGTGYSLMQLTYQYHLGGDDEFKHFQIKPKPLMPNPDEMLLEVCFTYQEPNTSAPATNMIIMEANLPSGFTTTNEFGNDLLSNELIQRIQVKNSETTLVIYFKKITANVSNCLHILAAKISDVLQRKPAAIAVYDYYNISRHNTVFYKI